MAQPLAAFIASKPYNWNLPGKLVKRDL